MNQNLAKHPRPIVLLLSAAVFLAIAAQIPVAKSQEPGQYSELWNNIKTGWTAEEKSFNERLNALQNEKLSPEELQKQSRTLVDEHMQSARKYAGKLNRIYNEACRRSGVKPSVGGDPASRFGRGLAGGDVDFSGTPAQVEVFRKTLVELGVPESELSTMERTPSRVTVESTMNFTVNYTPPGDKVGTEQHRQTILEGATDIEHDLSVAMENNQPGRQLVAVESNIKKSQKGIFDNPADLLQNPDHLQPAVKGALKNTNFLTEADLKVLLKRNGIAEPVDQIADMMKDIKSQGGHLAPGELHGLDAAKMAKFQNFLRDVNAAAEWKALMQTDRQARIAADIHRELAASNDPLIRRQITDLQKTWIDSRLRIEASVLANQAKTMELLHLDRNAKAHQIEELQKKGPSPELDNARAELEKINERLAKTSEQQSNFRRIMESQLKSVGQPAEPGSAGRATSDWLADAKTRFLSTEVRPGIRTLGDAAGKALAGLGGVDEYQQNRQAGRGYVYSAAGGALKTGVMLNPLGVVYFAPETAWNSAKAAADAYIHDEIQRLMAEGKNLDRAEAERIARQAMFRGTLVGSVFGGAVVSQIATLLFPASTTAAFAGPIGLVVMSGGFAWSQYEPIRRDRAAVKWNESQQIQQFDEALQFGRQACAVLTPWCNDIEREIAALNALIGRAENGDRSYDFHRERFMKYRDYIDAFNRRIESIKAALAAGALNPSADGRLYAEFDAVKHDSDEISAEVDRTIAEYKARTITFDAVRQQYSTLLKQFTDAQKRDAAARRAFDDLRLLAQLPMQIDGYNLARQKAEQELFLAKNRSEQLASIGESVPARASALSKSIKEFTSRRAAAIRGLEHFLIKGAKRSDAQDSELQGTVNLIRSLSTPAFNESTVLTAGADLRHCAGVLRVLSETKLPDAVSFDGLAQYYAASQTAVFDLSKIAADAQTALERARKQLERLAALVDSPPPEIVKTQPPGNNSNTQLPPPGQQPPAPGGASVREVSRNVFRVEMANMPKGARFIWSFGDGSPQFRTNSPQVQHNYVAPTGGIAGLAGKKWPLNVTISDASGRIIGNASIIVTRSRLTDSPIQKRPY